MLLAIETATAACSVALLDGERIVAERHEIVGRGHAERLIPQIDELIGHVFGASPPSIHAIAVDCGPGSFTGVRVGLAAARALGLGWGVPVSGFSSLALIAAAAMADIAEGEQVGVAISGGHGELFVQGFTAAPLYALSPLASLSPEAAADLCAAPRVFGSGAAALVAARGHGEAHDVLPRAADTWLLPPALASLSARPIYGRAPDARPTAQALP